MRAAVYCRVSSSDQSTEMQLRDLRKLADGRGFQIVTEFCDEGVCGAESSRPELNKMLAAAKRGEFEVVLIWKLDRLGRSLGNLIRLLEDFKSWNVALISFSESLDFSTSTGTLFYQMIGAFAQFERECIRERTRSGLRNARARGVRLGRRVVPVDIAEVQRLRAEGNSYKHISATLKVSVGSLYRAMRSSAA
jgi:DNA invertase Pin-like site-specific DNA recombinase